MALAAALPPLCTVPRAPAAPEPAAELVRLERELFEAVNALRERHGLLPLRRDAALDGVARAHSADMSQRRYLAHETPEGANPVQRLQRAGVAGFSLAAENAGLTRHSAPNREILRGWLESPVHRVNLFAPVFNTTGLGIARAPDGALFYTQLYVTFPRDTSRAGGSAGESDSFRARAGT